MKTIKLLFVVTCLLFIPFITNAEECNPSNIKIKNIVVKDKSNDVEELSNVKFENNKLNLDLKMYEVGDYIEYQLEIENDSNDDFYLNKDSLNIDYNYFNYSISYNDYSNKFEPKGKKIVYLKVEYKKKVKDNKFQNDKYVSNNNITLKLFSNDNSITNPFTKSNKVILTIGLLLVVILTLYYTRSKKSNKILILLMGIIIPFEVLALCNFELYVNSKITIGKVENNSDDNSIIYTTNIWDADNDTIADGTNNTVVWLGKQLPNSINSYETPELAMEALKQASGGVDRPFYLKHVISNNIVTELYVGFVITPEMVQANPGMTAGTYYLKGNKTYQKVNNNWQCMSEYDDGNGNCLDPEYNANIETLISAFGASYCNDYTSLFRCSASGLYATAYSIGNVYVANSSWGCETNYIGYSNCYYN